MKLLSSSNPRRPCCTRSTPARPLDADSPGCRIYFEMLIRGEVISMLPTNEGLACFKLWRVPACLRPWWEPGRRLFLLNWRDDSNGLRGQGQGRVESQHMDIVSSSQLMYGDGDGRDMSLRTSALEPPPFHVR